MSIDYSRSDRQTSSEILKDVVDEVKRRLDNLGLKYQTEDISNHR